MGDTTVRNAVIIDNRNRFRVLSNGASLCDTSFLLFCSQSRLTACCLYSLITVLSRFHHKIALLGPATGVRQMVTPQGK